MLLWCFLTDSVEEHDNIQIINNLIPVEFTPKIAGPLQQGWICALMLLIFSLCKSLKGLFGLIPVARPEEPSSTSRSLLPPVGTA